MNWFCPLPGDWSSLMRLFFCRGWSLPDTKSKNLWPPFLSSAPDSFRDLQNSGSATPGKVVVLIAVENWGFCVSRVVWLMMCEAGKAAFGEALRCGGGGSKFKSTTKLSGLNRESRLGVLVQLCLKALASPQTKYGKFEHKERCRSHTHKLWEITADGY